MTTRFRLLMLALLLVAEPVAASALRVVTTLPDLADLARQVGGDQVKVQAMVRGPQDPHFIQARPSFVSKLHRADLFIETGMDLEIGWAPVLLRSARNPEIRRGGPGFLDASAAIAPLEVPMAGTNRSMGDLHPLGNPHYLTDPLNGLRVAALIRDRLSQLRPEQAETFDKNLQHFSDELLGRLVGADVAARFGASPLMTAIEQDRLAELLAGSKPTLKIGGWLGMLPPGRHVKAVQDHRLYPYFARRFGLLLVAELEPRPGIAPTTAHLKGVIDKIKAEKIPILLASPYFDPRFARSVAEKTGITVVPIAHQVGSRPGTDSYLAMVDYNVRQVAEAIASR